MARYKINKISGGNFSAFGKVIEYAGKNSAGKKKNLFCKVVVENKKTGWRIAYLVVREKVVDKLERHPGTWESFEPVCGRPLLFVAGRKDVKAIRCFYLDKPVVLKKGTWHGVVTLGSEAEIKITENARVKSEYWRLDSGF